MILMPKGPENKSLLMIQKAHRKKTTTNFFLFSKECIITTTSFQVNCEENSVRVKSARKLQKSEVFQFECLLRRIIFKEKNSRWKENIVICIFNI